MRKISETSAQKDYTPDQVNFAAYCPIERDTLQVARQPTSTQTSIWKPSPAKNWHYFQKVPTFKRSLSHFDVIYIIHHLLMSYSGLDDTIYMILKTMRKLWTSCVWLNFAFWWGQNTIQAWHWFEECYGNACLSEAVTYWNVKETWN